MCKAFEGKKEDNYRHNSYEALFDNRIAFEVDIQYCDLPSYVNMAAFARQQIENAYPLSTVRLVKIRDESGCLEVVETASGRKVHSKLSGDGAISQQSSQLMLQRLKNIVEGPRNL